MSTKIVEYTRSIGITVTGTCRDTGGVIQELLDLKKKDRKDIILRERRTRFLLKVAKSIILDRKIKPLF
jgi:hypothetical protein